MACAKARGGLGNNMDYPTRQRDYYGREVPPLLMFRQVQLPAAGEGSTSGRREGFTIRTNLTAIEGKRLLQPRSPLGRDEGADTCPLIPQPLLDLI